VIPDQITIFTVTFYTVIACWFVFAAAFLLRKRPVKAREQARDNRAFTGIFLEACGFALVWMFRRYNAPLVPAGGNSLALFLSAIAVILAVASTLLTVSAIRALGKQWAVAARVVEGHSLVTHGPYGLVRNPIYSGMFGMLIATGMATSHWWALAPAVLLFWAGTVIRVKSEEQLLLSSFGPAFEQYRESVPALIPKLF
jgi:protein-S-isoprenylcysteine O-methyltransferase Ste14